MSATAPGGGGASSSSAAPAAAEGDGGGGGGGGGDSVPLVAAAAATAAEPASVGAAAVGAATAAVEAAVAAPAPEKKKTYPYRPPRLGDTFQATVPSFGPAGGEAATSTGAAPSTSKPRAAGTGGASKKGAASGRRSGSSAAAGGEEQAASTGPLAAPPPETTTDLRPMQRTLRDGLIWDPNALPSEEVDDYLTFTRGLMEQTSHTRDRHAPRWRRKIVSVAAAAAAAAAGGGGNGAPSGSGGGGGGGSGGAAAAAPGTLELIPLEADEQALYYLFQQKYDVDVAALRLISELGAKKEYKFLHALDTLYQSGASAAALDRRDRSSLLGSYASGGTPYAGYARGGRPSQYPYPYAYASTVVEAATGEEAAAGAGAGGAGAGAGKEPEDEDDAAAPAAVAMEEDEEDEAAGGASSVSTAGDNRKKRSGADKTETKKQYSAVLEKAQALAKAIDAARKGLRAKASAAAAAAAATAADAGGDGSNNSNAGAASASAAGEAPAVVRPEQAEIFAVLKEYSSLPSMDLPPGENPGKEMDKALTQLRDALADSRQYVARVHDALNTTAAAGPSTLEELEELLDELRQQPVLLREEAQLARVIAEAKAWQAEAEDLEANMESVSLLTAQALITAAASIPVRFELHGVLRDRVAACVALGKEMRSAIPAKSRNMQCQKIETIQALLGRARELRLQFHEVDLLGGVLARAEKWMAEAGAAVSESPDLKRLQGLLEEANSIPVDLSEMCEVIQGKVEQAQKWVEKVRKALPRKNKTRSNASEAGKVDYSAARTLLSEGAGMRVDVKELDDIAGVLDTAETWLQRVREALQESTDEAGLESLQALLSEADDIPVEMDEHKILAAEIEARRWGLRAQPRLADPKVTVAQLEALVAEAVDLRARLPVADQEQKSWRLPQEVKARRMLDRAQAWLRRHRKCLNPNGLGFRRGVTVGRLLRLQAAARAVPVDLSQYLGPMEAAVEGAKQWLEEWTPLLQACGIRARSTFEMPPTPEAPPEEEDDDHAEGQEAEEGGENASAAMEVDGDDGGDGGGKGAGGKRRGRGQQRPPPEEEGDDEDEDEDEAGAADEEGMEALPTTGEKIEQEQLTECVAAANALDAQLPEAERIKALQQRVQGWLEQLGVVCPKRLSKRRGVRQKMTVEEVRALVAEGEALPVGLEEEMAEIHERLEATLKWQTEVQADLREMAEEALRESVTYKIVRKKKGKDGDKADGDGEGEGQEAGAAGTEEQSAAGSGAGSPAGRGGKKKNSSPRKKKKKGEEGGDDEGEQEEEEDVNAGLFGDTYDRRLARIDRLLEPTTDAGIESAEDEMAARHKEAHKWFANAIDLLEFVDPDEPISDLALAEIEDFVQKGEALLYQAEPKEDKKAAAKADEQQQEQGATAAAEPAATPSGSPTASKAGEEQQPGSPAAMEVDGAAASPSEQPQPQEEAGAEAASDAAVAAAATGAALASGANSPSGKKERVLVACRGPCDETLQECLLYWWEQTRRVREVWEASRGWARRATRIVGTGGERVRMEVLEGLLAQTEGWDFELESARKVRQELNRARSILNRAKAALEGTEEDKLELPALKSLIVEGDKCKVQIEDVKALRRHLAAAQRWSARFQKARPEDLEEMLVLAEEAKEVRANLGEDYATVMHRITRCCFCRQPVEGPTIKCTECGEKYHQKCLDIRPADAENWESRGWCCPRCLVRWHMRDALAKTMVLVSKWIANPAAQPLEPPAYPPAGITWEEVLIRMRVTTAKVKAWMKRLLHAVMACAERNTDEVRTLGSSRLVKGSVLVDVIRLAKGDPDVDACGDVKEVIWNLSVVFWGARLICQLRRRPSLVPLQALTAEMRSVGIHNEPLQVMLNSLITRALGWIATTKPILRDGWLRRDEAPLDVERLRQLVAEKKAIPVRLLLERRVEAMLSEELPGKRYCHCRGFYDGFFMVQCVACNEWFHGKCVQLRAEDLDRKTEYQCVACCEVQKIDYPYPPYRPPDPDQALAEAEEEEDEEEPTQASEDEELFFADKRSLEGIFPCEKKLASLDRASAHVDIERLPVPAALKRKKSEGADAGAGGGGAGGPAGAGGGAAGRKRVKTEGGAKPSGGKRKAPGSGPSPSSSSASLTSAAAGAAGAAGLVPSATNVSAASVASAESDAAAAGKQGRKRKTSKQKVDELTAPPYPLPPPPPTAGAAMAYAAYPLPPPPPPPGSYPMGPR